MRVKHLIRELQKCDQESDVVIRTEYYSDNTFRLIEANHGVYIDTRELLDDYHTMDDTPYPLSEKE